MKFNTIRLLTVLLMSTIGINSYSEVLISTHYVYGDVASERGMILKKIPDAKAAYRLECQGAKCKKAVSGYMVRRTPELDKAVNSHLAKFAEDKKKLLNDAADSASFAVAQDIASTSMSLANGATELNPLLGASPSGALLLAVGLIRHQVIQAQANDTRLSYEVRARNVCMSSGMSQGAAANNIALLATGAGALPVILGFIVGKARMDSCLSDAMAAHNLLIHQENLALLAYAESLTKTLAQADAERSASVINAAL